MVGRVIRDPLYGDIKLSFLESMVLDHPAFQRLRRITQLAGAPFVYPAAVHTRFSHSLGTVHVARLFGQALDMELQDMTVTCLYALLHDVGHGPFSHSFEEAASGWLEGGHEHMGLRIAQLIKEDLLTSPLEGKVGLGLKEEAQEIGFYHPQDYIEWAFSEMERCVASGDIRSVLVDGPLGADRLDFIARDAYFTGVTAFNTVDIYRLVGNVLAVEGRVAFRSKVVDNIYGVLVGRFLMYRNVYYHKTSRAADLMIQRMISFAIAEGILDPFRDIKGYTSLDEGVLTALVRYRGSDSKAVWEKLAARKLWKMVHEETCERSQAEEVARSLQLEYPNFYIDVPSKLHFLEQVDYQHGLLVEHKGQIMPLAQFQDQTGYSLIPEEVSVFVRVYKEVL